MLWNEFSPHMKKLYGDAIRKEAGLTKTLRQKAMVRLKKTPAVRIEEKIKEVQGTFEHIYDETVIALDDFLEKCEVFFFCFLVSPLRKSPERDIVGGVWI